MAHLEEKVWTAGVSGRSRRDREPCRYKFYLPDTLSDRRYLFEGSVTADVTDAERAIVDFNAGASALASTEALARILLRAESLASSRIEGMVVGARRILKAEVERGVDGVHADRAAAEILANIEAMDLAITQIGVGSQITLETILEVNRKLLANTDLSDSGGKLRQEQNWIGGNEYNPCSADFVPPEWETVVDLMGDLVKFSNQDDLPAVAQAALAHSQFETIHPFVDGNGRTGRVLIQMILRRRGLSPNVVPPVSLILATQVKEYVEGLKATRYSGDPQSQAATEGINLWVGRFAAACIRSVEDAMRFETRAKVIETKWRNEIPKPRAGSSLDLLLRGLVGMPILTVSTAMKLTGSSRQQTGEAVNTLVAAGILERTSNGLRNVSYEAPEIIEAFTSLERELGSPIGDTRTAPPTRPVPARIVH